MRLSNWLLPVSALATLAAVPLSACSSNKNHEEREATPEAMAGKPVPVVLGDPKNAAMLGEGLPDPGSRAIDCAKALGADRFEYAWAWDLAAYPHARATYVYDDNTPTVQDPIHNGWEPVPASQKDMPTCDGFGAVHFMGGTFTEYGGGFGMSFCTTANPCANMPALKLSDEFPDEPNSGILQGAYDLTGWTGVALWIRRGPNGQSGLRVGITERNSSEDLNTGTSLHPERESRYCRRYRLCGCAPEVPCSPEKALEPGELMTRDTRTLCWDPSSGEIAPDSPQPSAPVEVSTLTCGVHRCDEPNVSFTGAPIAVGLVPGVDDLKLAGGQDPLFFNRGCNPAVQSDGHVDYFCYNPGQDPTPPAKRERCGSPFSRPITADLDWQLVRVPFTELRQNDDVAVADEIDLKSVKQLVFTHTTGNIDFWIANVGFYKQR